MINAPPPVLNFARVLAYAILDESVQWTGRQTLFYGGREVGPVPCLALCQNTWGNHKDILLFHCNVDWEVLGTSSAPSLDEARASAENAYRGVDTKWIMLNTSEEEAREWIRRDCKNMLCSFCERIPPEIEQLIRGKSAGICNYCAGEIPRLMKGNGKTTDDDDFPQSGE